eukprot:CAMPEP_0201569774 /NCGR_PEP_ID=MMETSP0190_2-20130828/11655_1 /ASSEMBLY_ACC=CAM_ASM_000263 /TAXON_ID=37353 /ORGANISM="Rosalina sp." /LENGTH=218 /DNA_ID=CAMNT_0047992511 /DNA_START=155 /DNA_END=808 /DNA_ORIENTATION=+
MSSKKKGGAKKGGAKKPKASDVAGAMDAKQWAEFMKSNGKKIKDAKSLAALLQSNPLKVKIGGAKKANLKAGKSPAKKAGGGDAKGGKVAYQFGSRRLNVTVPDDYAKIKSAEGPPKAGLQLKYAHGYSGNFDESRQNVYLTSDGKNLIYYIAAVVVVMNVETGTQEFFTRHNDDITTVAVQPGPGDAKKGFLVASGQKDPKDDPSAGKKDLPKIYCW